MPRLSGATRTDLVATAVVLVAAAAVALLGPLGRRLSAHPTPEQCAAILDRWVEHTIRASDPKPAPAAIAERKLTVRAGAAGFVARCAASTTLAEAECASRAASADDLERCLP